MNPINDKTNWNLVLIIVLGTFVPICLILVTYIYCKSECMLGIIHLLTFLLFTYFKNNKKKLRVQIDIDGILLTAC